MIKLPQEIEVIQSLMQTGDQVFLVGGAIRDALLSKPNQDLDFVCTGDPRIIGRILAEKLSGAFFMLDEERSACRVIAKNDQGKRLVFDFMQMRGLTLENDLEARDFTINAMAVDLTNPVQIIDPLLGEQDLFGKSLRPCKESSFDDDPLRVIRAVRYSVKYNLQIESNTIHLLKTAVYQLEFISKERKRDELFKILESENPWLALDLFAQFGILPYIKLDNLPDMKKALSRLQILDDLIKSLSREDQRQITFAPSLSSVLSTARLRLADRFMVTNQSERSIHALDGLVALLWDLDEVEGARVAEELALSREEQDQICISLRHKCCIKDYFSSQKMPDRKFLYRYFQVLGITGLDVAVLTLAEAAKDESYQIERWSGLLVFCQKLIEIWFINPEYIYPKLFLTGRDLMFEFDIPQGPLIGQLLDGLREEQAVGYIQNRTQALAWVDGQLQKSFISK